MSQFTYTMYSEQYSTVVDKQNQLIVAIVLLHQERKQQRKNNYASLFHNISSSVVSSLRFSRTSHSTIIVQFLRRCALWSMMKCHKVSPTKRTNVIIYHPFNNTALMKNVIALICFAPAYSLACFIAIQTNGTLRLGISFCGPWRNVFLSRFRVSIVVLSGSKDTFNEWNAVIFLELPAKETFLHQPLSFCF
jgi:hypothetical protein